MKSMLSQYYSSTAPAALLQETDILSVIHFDKSGAGLDIPGCVPIGMASLSGSCSEVIRVAGHSVTRGRSGSVQWSCGGGLMFAAIRLSASQCEHLEQSAEAGYRELFGVLLDAGYPNPFRMWNFLPDINRGEGDAETYKQFCVGRERGFASLGMDTLHYPAASALGHTARGAVVYALASAAPVVHYENPKQQPAYRYPRKYGPSSPSFARASATEHAGVEHVFVSGTASILGHETKSVGSLVEQLELTIDNIGHLLERIGATGAPLSAVRVYLRHGEHYEVAARVVEKSLLAQDINFLLADICREDLLVEIEAATQIRHG